MGTIPFTVFLENVQGIQVNSLPKYFLLFFPKMFTDLTSLGVATYCRENVTPLKAEEGITGKLNSVNNRIEFYEHIQGGFTDNELRDLDSEGRCVMTLHQFKVNINSFLSQN